MNHDYFGYEDPDFLEKNAGAPAEMFEVYGTKRGGTEIDPNYTNFLLSNS